jgi:hypothetical protein
MLAAALDFQRSVPSGKGLVYPSFARAGSWIALPHTLDVARQADGIPDFHLELVRLRRSAGELSGFGMLDVRVAPVLDLTVARDAVGGADVSAGFFAGGWLRLLTKDAGSTAATTMLPPVRISSNGLGVVRLAARLTTEGAALLKRALLEGALLAEAWAEMEVVGVAPRHPLVVKLQASRLAGALAADVRDGLVSRAAVVTALARQDVIGALPGQLAASDIAEAVADRLRNLCAVHVPSPGTDFEEWWRLDLGTGDTSLQWDLATPTEAVRINLLRFEPIGLVRAAMSAGGLGQLITERELPEFDTGIDTIFVTANLPETRSPVLSCGVDLVAEPAPPRRMHTIRETVEFVAPDDKGQITLRLAPGEPRGCSFETFVVTETSSGVNEWRAPRKTHPGGDLRLAIGDFAARWIPVGATDQLLAVGDLSIMARWSGNAQTVSLVRGHRLDTLAIPSAAVPLEFRISLRNGPRALEVQVAEADLRFLDLPLFLEYGAHTVEVAIDLTAGPDVIALDFVAEGEPDTAALTLPFTRSRSSRSWSWFARSPLAPGYRYRLFQSDGPPRPWSEPQSASAPLRLSARDLLQVVPS